MQHLLAKVKISQEYIRDEKLLYNSLLQSAHDAGATVLGTLKHEFHPFGLTAVVILAESHISLHTYPEDGVVYLDAFTCGKLSPKKILRAFCKLLGAEVARMQIIRRK